MKKYLLLILLLPFISYGQHCDTVTIGVQHADTIIYCITNASCHDTCNGSIMIDVRGNNQPYSFEWNNSNISTPGDNSRDSLCASSHLVTITDVNGNLVENSQISTVEDPPNFSVFEVLTNPTCFNDTNGSIALNIGGATPPYTYQWDNGVSSLNRNNLDSGIYVLTTMDANHCIRIDTFELINPAKIISTITADTLSCIGPCDGGAIVVPDFGVPPYTFEWDDPLGQITASADSLCYGLATVFITDDNGCLDTNAVFIENPDTLKLSNITIDSSCYQICDGELSVTIEGGTSPYDIEWSLGGNIFDTINTTTEDTLCPGNYQIKFTDANLCVDSVIIPLIERDSFLVQDWVIDDSCYNSCTAQITVQLMNQDNPPFTYNWSNGGNDTVISNLCSDTFDLVIIDNRLCSDTFNFFVEPGDSMYFDTVAVTHNSCYGDEDGVISLINFNGGVLPLDYLWSTSETTSGINSLPSGFYNVTITDANGCSIDYSNIEVSQPNELTSSYTQTNVSCFGVNDGSAIVNFFGGTIGSIPGDTNYILGWAGTPMPVYLPYPQTVFNTSLLPNPYNQIPAGVYPYTVTDLNGCTIYDTITITEPDSLYTTYSTTNFSGYEISCFGGNDGEIDIQVNGGTAPFDNYLNGSLQSSLITSNLSAGSYTDSIEDANGCTAINTIILNEPPELVSTLTPTNISCNGVCDGEIISGTSGGVLPYSYSWTSIPDTTADISNLCAGLYTLTISDANGCTENSSVTIYEPSLISFSIDSISQISTYGGNDGAIYISAGGGVGNLTYYWTNPFTFTSTSEDIDNLIGAIYSLNITDSNSCTLDTLIELTQPSSLVLNLDSAITISCYDSCDASLFISANGGDSTYTYSWTGPNGFVASTANISNLCYGEYILVLDDSITMLIDTFNIYQPQPLSTTLTTDSILCHNGTTQAEINVWGGTQSFDYLWSNGATTYITSLSSGNYTVTATDQNGCAITNSISLGNPDSIYAQTSTVNVSCNGLNNGEVQLSITGGLTPYSYSDDGGNTYQNSNVFDNLSIGTYTYLITDFNGCLSSAFAEIIQPISITSITESDSVSCYGNCDGVVYAFASGGNSPYSYDWGGNSSNLCSGNYNVIITDANGCLATNTAIVYEPFPLAINIWINGNTIEATSGFDSYQWYYANGTLIPGETSEIYEPLSVGEYYVVVADGDCEEVSYAINYNISGIDNLDNNISIYPNPTMGILTIEGGSNIQNIIILNTLGNQLLSVENNSNDYSKSEIDLTTFAKGIYFIQVEQNNQIMNYRIVLQ